MRRQRLNICSGVLRNLLNVGICIIFQQIVYAYNKLYLCTGRLSQIVTHTTSTSSLNSPISVCSEYDWTLQPCMDSNLGRTVLSANPLKHCAPVLNVRSDNNVAIVIILISIVIIIIIVIDFCLASRMSLYFHWTYSSVFCPIRMILISQLWYMDFIHSF